MCSAKQTQLLNPVLGFDTKGRLRSCRGPYGFPHHYAPYYEKGRGAVFLNRGTGVDGKRKNKMQMLKGADIIFFI